VRSVNKLLEIDLDNLHIKFATRNANFNRLSFDYLYIHGVFYTEAPKFGYALRTRCYFIACRPVERVEGGEVQFSQDPATLWGPTVTQKYKVHQNAPF